MNTVYVLHSPDVDIEIEKKVDIYCQPKSVYFITQPDNLNHLKTLYAIEKEKNEWIRKYENVLNGLRYWQSKALENE